MYGTIARLRIRKDAEDRLLALLDAMEERPVAGSIASYVYRLDNDPQDLMLAVLFTDRDAYVRNADDPAQDAEYRKLRELLERDPEWHDGEVHSRSTYARPHRPTHLPRGVRGHRGPAAEPARLYRGGRRRLCCGAGRSGPVVARVSPLSEP
jgi:hypothetical protein